MRHRPVCYIILKMRFNNRQEAAIKLYRLLRNDSLFIDKSKAIVVSILRGGVILGSILSKKIDCLHLPLIVIKISAPYNPELAIGALCFNVTYLEREIIKSLGLSRQDLQEQVKIAEYKFIQFCNRFGLNEKLYTQAKNKILILVDDGVATGASVKAACLFLKSMSPKKITLATPVAAADTDLGGFDKLYILNRPASFGAVSQYYSHFPQVEDQEVKQAIQ